MKPDYAFLKPDWYRLPAHWVTIGFLVAIFFAPWGPVLRYLGWFIAGAALVMVRFRGQTWGPVLDRPVAWILGMLLVVGAITTAVMKSDLYRWVKGYSQLVEFAFALWLSAWVFLNQENGIMAWLRVWYAGTMIFLAWGVMQFLIKPNGEILFSNINSLGLYICLVLPLLFGAAFRPTKSPLGVKILLLAGAVVGLLFLALSTSLTAWITGALQLVLFFCLLRPARQPLAAMVCGLSVLLALIIFLSPADSPLGSIRTELGKEVFQLQSITEPSRVSSSQSRLDIARVAAHLIRERPLFGWGWGRFDRESQQLATLPGFSSMEEEAFAGNGHSMYLNLLVMGGIVAFCGVCLIHVRGVLLLIKRRQSFDGGGEIAIPAVILIASMLLYSLGGDVFGFRYKAAVLFWTVLGFACQRCRETTSHECS